MIRAGSWHKIEAPATIPLPIYVSNRYCEFSKHNLPDTVRSTISPRYTLSFISFLKTCDWTGAFAADLSMLRTRTSKLSSRGKCQPWILSGYVEDIPPADHILSAIRVRSHIEAQPTSANQVPNSSAQSPLSEIVYHGITAIFFVLGGDYFHASRGCSTFRLASRRNASESLSVTWAGMSCLRSGVPRSV